MNMHSLRNEEELREKARVRMALYEGVTSMIHARSVDFLGIDRSSRSMTLTGKIERNAPVKLGESIVKSVNHLIATTKLIDILL